MTDSKPYISTLAKILDEEQKQGNKLLKFNVRLEFLGSDFPSKAIELDLFNASHNNEMAEALKSLFTS